MMSDQNFEETEQSANDFLEVEPVSPEKHLPEQLVELSENLASLHDKFDAKLRYDQHKEKIINDQFQELQQFRSEIIEKLIITIMRDMIVEIDDIEKLVRHYETAEYSPENFRKVLKIMQEIPDSLRVMLEKHEILSYQSESGTLFQPGRQRSLKITPTSDPELDKTIIQSLRWGFERNGKILRPEMVDVYVFKNEEANDVVNKDK